MELELDRFLYKTVYKVAISTNKVIAIFISHSVMCDLLSRLYDRNTVVREWSSETSLHVITCKIIIQ